MAMRPFFFQAEDGIRDWSVTGVQTCALPIFLASKLGDERLPVKGEVLVVGIARELVLADMCGCGPRAAVVHGSEVIYLADHLVGGEGVSHQIGRASCREREGTRVWGARLGKR